MKQRLFAILLVLVLIFMAVSVAATEGDIDTLRVQNQPTQEFFTNTPTVEPTLSPTPVEQPPVGDDEPASPGEAADFLLDALRTVTHVAYVASLVLIVTQFLKVAMTKLLPQKYWISPAMLTLGVQVIFWVGHVVTNQLGYGQQYRDVLQVVESVLKAFQPLLPVTIVTGLSAHAAYNLAHKSKQPGFQMQVAKKAA